MDRYKLSIHSVSGHPLSIFHLLMSYFQFYSPLLLAHESHILTSLDHFPEQVLCAQKPSCPLDRYIYPSRPAPVSQMAVVRYSKTQLCGYNHPLK